MEIDGFYDKAKPIFIIDKTPDGLGSVMKLLGKPPTMHSVEPHAFVNADAGGVTAEV